VQHEIVSGLKYTNAVKKKFVTVASENIMLGSYRAQKKPHVVTFPRHGWDEAPSGAIARGSYSAKSKFFDDDKNKYLEYEYAFKIAKAW
jgi:Rho GDP-dissociation inhibitor